MRRTLIALAFVAGLVAACSSSAATGGLPAAGTQAAGTQAASGNPAGGAPMTPVACSLTTAAEAAAALGVPVNPAVGSVDPKENACIFTGTALTDMAKFVEIAVIDPVEFTPTRQSVPSSFDMIPTSGIGDAAYYQKGYLPNTGGWVIIDLNVRKGQTTFRVSVVDHTASDSPIMAGEKTLALAALGRI